PGFCPRKVFHPHSATGTLDSAWLITQFQRQLPHRKIAPLPFFADIVNLPAALPANPAAQESFSQPVNMHQHALVSLFHAGHGMGFQTQLFSDKRLYEHLGSALSYSLVGNTKLTRRRGASQIRINSQLQAVEGIHPQFHSSER